MKKYYLYRHIREDKNDVFYIGIGTNTKDKPNYSRAKSTHGRNSYWHNIVNKTNYKVEIIMESNNIEFIKNKEIEFINIYGRKDLNKGNLVNMTNGGDGCLGSLHTFKYKEIYLFNRELKFINSFKNAKEVSLFIYKTDIYHKNITTNCKFGNLTNRKYYVALKERYDNNDIVFKNVRKPQGPRRNNCKSFYYLGKFYETKESFKLEVGFYGKRFYKFFNKLIEKGEITWK